MTDNYTGHSADVKMHVERNGSKLQISQLGPDFLLLDEADDFEGPAQVSLGRWGYS
jgi:N12 class adenine-specific DNA methylase